MLEVDQLFPQVEYALRGQGAALLVLQLALHALRQAAARREHEVECRGRIERSRHDAEQGDARKLLLIHAREVEGSRLHHARDIEKRLAVFPWPVKDRIGPELELLGLQRGAQV